MRVNGAMRAVTYTEKKMSRQNKQRNKRTARIRATREIIVDPITKKETFGDKKVGRRMPWGMPK